MYRPVPLLAVAVTRTVDDLRNDVRRAVDRFEREGSTAFTKESLAAICEAVGYDVDPNRLPSKSRMRAAILRNAGVEDVPDDVDRPFRKGELEAIAAAVE